VTVDGSNFLVDDFLKNDGWMFNGIERQTQVQRSEMCDRWHQINDSPFLWTIYLSVLRGRYFIWIFWTQFSCKYQIMRIQAMI
jgi:hypothetical protein